MPNIIVALSPIKISEMVNILAENQAKNRHMQGTIYFLTPDSDCSFYPYLETQSEMAALKLTYAIFTFRICFDGNSTSVTNNISDFMLSRKEGKLKKSLMVKAKFADPRFQREAWSSIIAIGSKISIQLGTTLIAYFVGSHDRRV